jgi:hypothetical protein
MTVFYRSPVVLVTHEVFETRCPCRQRFWIKEMRNVRVAHSGFDRVAVASAGLAASVTVAAAAALPVGHTPQAWLAALVILAPGAFGGAYWRHNPPEWHLFASYRGYEVQLYHNRDLRTFSSVRRAVLRAMEDNTSWYW